MCTGPGAPSKFSALFPEILSLAQWCRDSSRIFVDASSPVMVVHTCLADKPSCLYRYIYIYISSFQSDPKQLLPGFLVQVLSLRRHEVQVLPRRHASAEKWILARETAVLAPKRHVWEFASWSAERSQGECETRAAMQLWHALDSKTWETVTVQTMLSAILTYAVTYAWSPPSFPQKCKR